jgi:UDP-N-acetylglucosamine 2-epimerase
VTLIDPVGYLEMLVLEENAEAVVTDSGGVQKEAYFAGRPCITLRDRTEWTETVEAGWNVLVGTDARAIANAMRSFRPNGHRPELFGDGRAAERAVEALGTHAKPNP